MFGPRFSFRFQPSRPHCTELHEVNASTVWLAGAGNGPANLWSHILRSTFHGSAHFSKHRSPTLPRAIQDHETTSTENSKSTGRCRYFLLTYSLSIFLRVGSQTLFRMQENTLQGHIGMFCTDTVRSKAVPNTD